VDIEQSRAIAEAQGKLVIAKKSPRDAARAYAQVMETCSRLAFAEEATYSLPRGQESIDGPSIRLAEAIARAWGNVDFGVRELSRKSADKNGDGYSEMQVYCWDLETNVQSSQTFTVRHWRDTRQGGRPLRDETEIYEVTASQAGRRLRSRILAIVPNDLVDAALAACRETLKKGGGESLTERVQKMIRAFSKLSITVSMLEGRLGHKLDAILPDEFVELQKIHASIKDGMSKASDWFGEASGIKKGTAPEKPNAALDTPAPAPFVEADVVTPVTQAEPVSEEDPIIRFKVWLASLNSTEERFIEVATREQWFEQPVATLSDLTPENLAWVRAKHKTVAKALAQ
jgi:hypothetical protein